MNSNRASFTAADAMPIKLLQNYELIKSIVENKIIPPLHVQLIPTNKCNLKCSFCSCENENRRIEMNKHQMIEVLIKLKNLNTSGVTITGGGEPLLWEYLNLLLLVLGSLNIKIGLVTNGVLLSKQNLLILNNLDWCRISQGDAREKWNPRFLDRLSNVIKSASNVGWAFSYVVSDNPDLLKIKELLSFAEYHKFTHVRLVSDLLCTDKIPMDELKTNLAGFIKDMKVPIIFQDRKQPEKGENCRVCYLRPVITPDMKIYACCLDENESVVVIDKDTSKITTKYIKDVQLGDYAFGQGEITHKFEKEGQESLKITLKTGRNIIVSKDHTMLIGTGFVFQNKKRKILNSYKIEEINADSLKIGDYLPVITDFHKEIDISHYEEEAYICGTYVADGWKSGSSIGLMLGKHKKERNKKILSILKDNYRIYDRRTGLQVMINTKNIFYHLFDTCGSRSLDKQLPNWLLSSREEVKLAFLDGYLTGDGYLQRPSKSYNEYIVKASTISKKLASDLVILYQSLNLNPVIRFEKRSDMMQIDGRECYCHDRYHINLHGNTVLSELLGGGKIHRQRNVSRATAFPKQEGIIFLPIKKIENVWSDRLYDLKVTGLNRFISSYGILTHNCGAQYALAKPTLNFPPELCLGNVSQFSEITENSSKPFDGAKLCEYCYYGNYNRTLDMLMTNTMHKEFI